MDLGSDGTSIFPRISAPFLLRYCFKIGRGGKIDEMDIRQGSGLPGRKSSPRRGLGSLRQAGQLLSTVTIRLTLPRSGRRSRMTHGRGRQGGPDRRRCRPGGGEAGTSVPLPFSVPTRSVLAMAVVRLELPDQASEPGPTPVHRLGEQVFDAVAEIGDIAHFSVMTMVWIVRTPVAMVGPGADLLRDRRLERPGGGDHRDVHRHGPGGAGASPVRHDGAGDPAGVGHQHLDRQGAGAGAGGDDAGGPGRLEHGRRAGDDARHRADRRPLGPGDQPDPLPGRPPVPGLRPA